MNKEITDPAVTGLMQEFGRPRNPPSGTADDDDGRDDEHGGENEAAVREVDENTEAPEEFNVDDEDILPHPEDDDGPGDGSPDPPRVRFR